MTRISENYGCKIGWVTFDDEAEAEACAAQARVDAERKAKQGYDFGYSVPGSITPRVQDGIPVWRVVIP